MRKKTSVEKYLGSLPVGVGANLLSISMGGVSSFLPFLTSTLASKRHAERIEKAFEEINFKLKKIEGLDESLSDAQYKLIAEMVSSILKTPDDEKIKILKSVIFKTPYDEVINLHEATIIARVLDQASAGELCFLIECNGRDISFGQGSFDNTLNIKKDSLDGEYALGLITLGLLARSSSEGYAGDAGIYQFTGLSKKIMEIVV